MSEKYGLDWRKGGYKRMNYFIEIMIQEAEKANRDAKKKK